MGDCFKLQHILEKNKYKQADMVLPVSPKVDLVTIALRLMSLTLSHESGE